MFLSVFLAFAFAHAGCGPHGPINWPAMVECVPDAVSDLAPVVSRILLANAGGSQEESTIGSRAKDELTTLASEHGANVISCLVQRFVSDWTSPGASQDPARIAAAHRGEDFLAQVGTRVDLNDPDVALDDGGGGL